MKIVTRYDCFLWDWDGCLAKSLEIWLEGYRQVFAQYGLAPKDREISEKVFGDWRGCLKLGIKDVDGFMNKLVAIVNEKLLTVDLYPEVKEVLAFLSEQGKKQILVTSSKKNSVLPAIENHHLEKFFDHILTKEDVSKHKPDPEIIEKALSLTNVDKKASVIIGDSKSDLQAAANAAIDSILFFPAGRELFYDLAYLESFSPLKVINSFRELIT